MIEGGCSDDGFRDFRAGLIALGKKVFDAALSDPDTLSSLPSSTWIPNEEFGTAAHQVYLKETGIEYSPKSPPSRRPAGSRWDFNDPAAQRARYPLLFAIAREDYPGLFPDAR